ncbi:FeoA family protein [Poseidonibacter lekithochrous]|uniref:FeoA family protein n=1 Tax=Poseidonibacter lekithochrous TaxID=1904463 RepID=UPI000D362EBB|nr:FeoA family protein [Poseidonibacter lekithochrous]
MTLDKLEIGNKATIKSINCDSALKNRFYSFGIIRNSIISVEELTLTKSTIEIKINSTKVALRLKEASAIEVEKCS